MVQITVTIGATMRKRTTDRDILCMIPLLHGRDSFESLCDGILQFASQLFEVDLVSYTQFDLANEKLSNPQNDADEFLAPIQRRNASKHFHEWSTQDANLLATRLSPLFKQTINSHPLVPFGKISLAAPSMRVCDVLSNAEFFERAFSREYLRHFGVKYQMIIPLEITPEFHSGVTLNRSIVDFTISDLELANLVRPHLYEAFRSVLLQERLQAMLSHENSQRLEPVGMGRLDVAFDGRIMQETPQARTIIRKVFPVSESTSSRLPPALYEWFQNNVALEVEIKPTGRSLSFSRTDCQGKVTISLLSVHYDLQYASLLVNYSARIEPIQQLHRNGLTRREAEVLLRLTYGETDKEIGQVLGMKPATARTHVERIRSKLQVNTRTAAAVIAQTWLRGTSDAQ
jgi:DNA-binding CsgD family transcriptional regulator